LLVNELETDRSDPTIAAILQAAALGRLLLQVCGACGRHQFYPRPFCLRCESDQLRFIESTGVGVVYSTTRVRLEVIEGLEPPYSVALIDLDEGPRLLCRVTGPDLAIGELAAVQWSRPAGGLTLLVSKAPPGTIGRRAQPSAFR
jgi:uncharacterized OB-fold protein